MKNVPMIFIIFSLSASSNIFRFTPGTIASTYEPITPEDTESIKQPPLDHESLLPNEKEVLERGSNATEVKQKANISDELARESTSANKSTSQLQATLFTPQPPARDELLLGDKNILKSHAHVNIPKVIYKVNICTVGTTCATHHNTSKGIMDAHKSWQIKNPGYEMKFFGLEECRTYLKAYFHPIVLRAFDCIEAFAGKVNLFRLAVVYREGGWYSDWKEMVYADNFLNNLSHKHPNVSDPGLIFAWDNGTPHSRENNCIMNGFFGAVPRHPMLAEAILLILKNVQREFYGETAQCNTGPCLMGQALRNFYGEKAKKRNRMRRNFPFFSGKYRWNEYAFEYKYDRGVVRHKSSNITDDWNMTNGNSYRELHDRRQYYCSSASSLFST